VLTDTTGYGWETATDLAYPLLDLGLLSLVATLLALTGWRPGFGWALFAVALSMQAISDVLYAREIALGTDSGDTLLAPLWPAAMLLLAYAAWRPLNTSLRRGVPLARVFIFPAAFTLIALGILVYDQIHSVNTLGVVLAATAIALAVGRMALSFLDNLRMLRSARHDALTDALTGLPNRRVWDEDLERELSRARRHGGELCLAMLDLDRFKAFNDEHGHQAGDRMLKDATAAWSAALRSTDLLCRYGGEEFGVVMPGATAEQAAEVLERLRAVTPQAQTFSAGVACWDGQEISDELVARADRALYAAKAAGRDRVTVGAPPVAAGQVRQGS
jgi:diguanylate cyclase (GGDEF)-like protein